MQAEAGMKRQRQISYHTNWMPKAWLLLFAVFLAAGCARDREAERIQAQQTATIQELNDEINRLNEELDSLMTSREGLVSAKDELERKLRDEMKTGDYEVSMQGRGLVVTVLDRVLFDSGKAGLKEGAMAALDKVGEIMGKEAQNHRVRVEGHTDNVPIRYSGWRSNWELSTARATEVIHFFVDQKGLEPGRFSAVGYGEFHPVVSNETPSGREKNRRVEIVISPEQLAENDNR